MRDSLLFNLTRELNISASTPPPPRKRVPYVWYAIALLLIILFATAPLLSIMFSSEVAEAHGCVLN